jgi:hypothetical protein
MVWVYNPALDNPYLGGSALLFGTMVGEAWDVAGSLPRFFSPGAPAEVARQSLLAYFAALRAGHYVEAVRLYGGDYAILTGLNPAIDPENRAALLEAACTVNGFVCHLRIGAVVQELGLSAQEHRFTVGFRNPDGGLFELGPCDDTARSECLPRTQFEYTVREQDGRFTVLELPVYVP